VTSVGLLKLFYVSREKILINETFLTKQVISSSLEEKGKVASKT